VELFGFEISRKKDEVDLVSFAPKETDDGALVVTAGGTYGTYLDMEGAAKTEAELVVKYREMALQPECERAIDDVTNEAIVKEGDEEIVTLNLDDITELSDKIKKIIQDEFDTITRLLNFNNFGYEIFRRWYVDGRLYYHIMIDENSPEKGIQELRYIDPRKIRKVRMLTRERKGKVFVNRNTAEFFVYNEKGFKATGSTGLDNQGLRISTDAILHCTSGLMDKDGKLVLSYLHKAIKPLNQLRILEDATVIYRISRAPERRVFYIDVGQMPKMKAEQHLRDMMTKHKNRLIYDANTGDVRDDRKFMTMLEDYWLPRREGQNGTEITTLPAGQNLGKLEDVEYFEKKLYRSLNVPVSRINPDQSGFNLGRPSEITRDELSFQKFIDRLRLRFSNLILGALGKQLVLKKIFAQSDWDEIKDRIHFDYARDNYFAELKDSEILINRLATLQQMQPFLGMFFSQEYVKKHVLYQSDDDIEEMQKQMDAEAQMMAAKGLNPDGSPMQLPPPDMGGEDQAQPGQDQQPEDQPQEPETPKETKDQIVQGKTGPYVRKMPVKKNQSSDSLPNNFIL
jgi:Bacteriophage T4-like portal protein (Gp20)